MTVKPCDVLLIVLAKRGRNVRFRKSIKVMPGVRLNVSGSGVSTSIGGRGATVNLSKRGVRSTLSVPGTGLSWSSQKGWSEGSRSSPADEIEQLRVTASKTMDAVAKAAEKVDALGVRIDRAIVALNGGRGITASKVQTFEKRMLTEEQKLSEIEEKVQENCLFLEAIDERLRAMKFGMFSAGKKRHRDGVADAVASCAVETRKISDQIAETHHAMSAKLTEVQEALEANGPFNTIGNSAKPRTIS
nr:DUF4236 domain-containing protein [Rhodovulum sulfidophilum]